MNIELIGDREVVAHLEAMPQAVHDALLRKTHELALQLEAKIKGKLSDDVLHVRSGALRRSIFSDVNDQGQAVYGRAASSGDVKYAAIQEFGGKTGPHDIVPVKAQALHWISGGKDHFAKIVHHPGSQIPERSYMRSSLDEMTDEITAGLKDAVNEGLGTR